MKMFFFDFFAKKESKTNHFHQNLFPKSLRLKNAFILRGIKKPNVTRHSAFLSRQLKLPTTFIDSPLFFKWQSRNPTSRLEAQTNPFFAVHPPVNTKNDARKSIFLSHF
jgi:hypothetical protein